jgi:hypothetical protein
MESWSVVVANASIIALLLMIWWSMRGAPAGDQRRMRQVILGVAGLVIAVGVLAAAWTLTRP